jgi:1-deoxy-D-xylulose-5-phosphate synthase
VDRETDLTRLDLIDSPEDLKKLTVPQLTQLSDEIRQLIVETVSKTGGHLGPSLGVVELTLALHYVYDFADDRLVWDVGHQCYPHKIITGRRDRFATLRQYGGISGFPKRDESAYDHFGTGHAGTSVSSALGMAIARDLAGDDYSVVAVLGDGAATAGMVYEALNNAGHMGTTMTVVLNDNAWSISPSVGAMNEYLNRLVTTPVYNRLRSELWRITGLLPPESKKRARKLAHLLQESIKNLLVPGTLFEELGFRYMGPVDGHSCSSLIRTFKYVKSLSGPVLVHVISKKGKGYQPAETDGQRLHGVGPFDRSNGRPVGAGGMTFTKAFGTTLVDLAKRDKRIVAITAAMPSGTGLNLFQQAIPGRFFDVGIAEQHAVTFAAGLATKGLKPFVAIYSSFMQRAYDQVIHDVCLQGLPVVLAIDRGGLVGEDGPTHHGAFDLSFLRPIPGLIVIAPSDEVELQRALVFAAATDGPVAIRYPRGKVRGLELDSAPRAFELGSSRVLREGSGIVLIGIGPSAYEALEAAQLLSKKGINATVMDARFVKPMDEERISEVAAEADLIVTIEDNALLGGFGCGVRDLLECSKLSPCPRVITLGLPDDFVKHGDVALLRDLHGLTAPCIAERIGEELGI